MKVHVAQMEVIAGEPEQNLQTILNEIKNAQLTRADIVVFPELCLSGYFINDLWESTAFLKRCEMCHEQIREASLQITVIFGSVGIDWKRINRDGRVRKYNAVFVISEQKFIKHPNLEYFFFIKTLLPLYREFDDARYFYDAPSLANDLHLPIEKIIVPVDLNSNGVSSKLGLILCEDGWDENYTLSPVEILSQKHKCQSILNLSASPYSRGKHQKRITNFSRLAKNNQCEILYVNAVGIQNTGKTIFGFDGQSAIYKRTGEVIGFGRFFESHSTLIEWNGTDFLTQVTPANPRDSISEIFQAWSYINSQVLKQWNIRRVVVGLSGGIDSALSACLFTHLLGPKNVFCINMPTQFNSQLTQSAAKELAKNLGCNFAVIPIQKSVDATLADLNDLSLQSGFCDVNANSFVAENIQARDRGARVLAAVAASLNAVFSCNANKTETCIGYSTLYGDAAGFLAPLADLWKFEVYALAKYFNEKIFKKNVIPQSIFDVTPSAELSAAQDVTQKKGDPLHYFYHDYLFRSWVENWEKKSILDSIQSLIQGTLEEDIGCPKNTVKKIFPSNEHCIQDMERWWNLFHGMGVVKRMQTPPIVAISRRAFGSDFKESLLTLGNLKYDKIYQSLRTKAITTSQ